MRPKRIRIPAAYKFQHNLYRKQFLRLSAMVPAASPRIVVVATCCFPLIKRFSLSCFHAILAPYQSKQRPTSDGGKSAWSIDITVPVMREIQLIQPSNYQDIFVSRKVFRSTNIVKPSSPVATVNQRGIKPMSPNAPNMSLSPREAAMFCLAIFTVFWLSFIK